VELHRTLRAARRSAGLSQAQAAAHLGITGASYSRMESGESAVTTDRLFRLAGLFGVSATALLEGSVLMPPTTIDLERLKLVIVEVEGAIARLEARPTPRKVADAVAEIYRVEVEFVLAHPKETFTPGRHSHLVDLIFRP
jgi:transcriptional regulator with XRE-family HTH domain